MGQYSFRESLYSFAKATGIKFHKLGEQYKFIFSVFRRLEVLAQGVTMAMVSLKVPGDDLFSGSLLVSDSFLVRGRIILFLKWCSPRVHFCVQIYTFSKDTSHFV